MARSDKAASVATGALKKNTFLVEDWPLAKIQPYEQNPRVRSKSAVEKVAASIREFSWRQPIVVDETGVILVGHTRLAAARELGLKTAPVHQALGLSEHQKRAYRIADNRTNEETQWNEELLKLELQGLDGFDLSLTGLDLPEINGLLSQGPVEGEDEVPEPGPAVAQRGDLWVLGEHRLLCGDATSAEDVGRLMDGARADLVWTDPPYGVAYDGGAKPRELIAEDYIGTEIYAKALPNLRGAAKDSAALYLWYADAHAAAAAAAAASYAICAQIVWVKNNAQFVTSAHYKGKHECCFYAHRKGKAAKWCGPNNEVTVWEANRSNKNEWHPTQKPVELCARAIVNSTLADDVVLDLFLGSGTAIIAAETEHRRCFGLEIEPRYCDVIIARWEKFTGKKAQRA